jgi:DNA-binding transcriptional regulator YhcF (GntR family)
MKRLDPDDSRPPYQQVTDELRMAIQLGTYGPGDKLPSYETTATGCGVSVGTVKRAYALLQQDGLIVIRAGLGSYVRTEPRSGRAPESGSIAEVNAKLAEIIRRLDGIERDLRTR